MRASVHSLALLICVTASGCAPLIEGLQNAEQRVVTLEPIKTGTRHARTWTNFGICHSRLETRISGVRSWFVFTATEPPFDSLAGHEVRVVRGESCHYREVHTFQAAVAFDLSSLPPGAITRAELTAVTLSSSGVDSPIGFGTTEQCRTLVLGRATADWDAGREGTVHIPGEGVRPAITGFAGGRSFNVTRTVTDWRDGRTPNLGFVIAPDPDAVARNAAAVGELTDQYLCPVMYRDFRLEVSMLVPGSQP